MRVAGIDPASAAGPVRAVLDAQTARYGAPLANHLIYARRPTIFRGARAMWSGLSASALLEPALVALLNRRVALINGCEF
ncbi:MAG: hypothetical protein NVSMB19_23980 [Vulcanimicrobiaceae bacterium]